MEQILKYSLALLLTLFVASAFGQRGTIITPASTSVMDPNGDGFVSGRDPLTGVVTPNTPFSNNPLGGNWVGEFELIMHGIPKLGGDVVGDNTGQPCGVTDLIPDNEGYSVYAAKDDNNNLIFRFRVGSNNPSVEAWTILVDIDGLFGADDPNATSFNPGFELDITLIKRNNAGILVYNIDGTDNCPTPLLNYPLSSNFQISIADEVSCGDADYFYDFFVPFPEIVAAFQALGFDIDINTGLRWVAVTNVSATCAMDGNIADISGVDYGDYGNCVPCAFTALVENQCPTAVEELCDTCEGFNSGLPTKPTIDEPIKAGQTVITGTAEDGTFIKLWVYPRIGGTDEEPIWSTTAREEQTVPVVGTTWSVTLNDPLVAYDRIVARAQLNAEGTGCGTASGNEASTTSVTVVEPNEAPVAEDQVVEVIEDTPKDIFLVASDPDGDALTYIIVTPPQHGVLTGTGSNVTYTPNQDYFGPDSFTFQVSDGVLQSNIATVTINVLPVNDAPVANDNAYSMDENTSLTPTVLNEDVSVNDSDVDGPDAIYSLVSGPSNGNLVLNTDGTFTYTPNLNFNGVDQFVYSLCDGHPDDELCDQATVTITVNPVNSPPVAVDDFFETDEGTPLSESVATNDSDPDGPSAIYSLISGPSNGDLILNADGTFTYTPDPNFNGVDQFVYSLCDGGTPNLCDNATVTITVHPVNDPPVAVDDFFETDEDTPLSESVATNDSDPDGPDAIYSLVSGPSNGNLVFNADGSFTYTPDLNFNGTDQFVYSLCDGHPDNELCDNATVTIIVHPVNDPPVAVDDFFETDEDTPLTASVAGNDSDVDGPDAIYSIVSGPSNGSLVLNADGTFTYTPDLNYNGTDQFVYSLCDGGTPNLCDNATVTITIHPVNDPPVITGSSTPTEYVTGVGGVIIDNTLQVTDVDDTHLVGVVVTISQNFSAGDNLIFVDQNGITGSYNPATGVLTLTGSATLADYTAAIASIIFENDGGPSLTRRITFVASDGKDNSLPWHAFIDFPGNIGGPILNEDTFFTDEDVPLTVCLDVTDPDGDAVFIQSFSGADGNGVFTLNGGVCFTFTPNPNFNGVENANVTLCDIATPQICNTYPIVINVLPVNDPPVAVDDFAVTDEEVPVTFNILTNDFDIDSNIDPTSVDLNPTNTGEDKTIVVDGKGTFEVDNSGNVTFTPVTDFVGVVVITYTVKDEEGAVSNIATITVTVNPVNDPPVANDDVFETDEDTPLTADVSINDTDVDGPDAIYSLVSGPSHGTLVFNADGSFTYTPDQDYFGTDEFVYQLCDGGTPNLCDNATVTITIHPVNDPPVVVDITVEVDEDNSIRICVEYTDIEGDLAEISDLIPSGGGTVVIDTEENGLLCFIYTPVPDFNGTETVTVIVCDVNDPNVCGSGTVTVIVRPVNDRPVAVDDFASTDEDTPVTFNILANDYDVDGTIDPTTVDLNPANPGEDKTIVVDGKGTFTVDNSGNVTFTPEDDFFGVVVITYTVKDNDGAVSNVATITVTVNPVNDPPVAVDDSFETDEDVPLTGDVSLNDINDGPQANYTLLTGTSNGTLVFNADGTFTYTPNQDYNGTDQFTYRLCDGGTPDLCDDATATIIIHPVNDPPVIEFIPVLTTKEDSLIQVCLEVLDVDGDPITFLPATHVKGASEHTGQGTMVLDPPPFNFCYTMTPALHYNGESIWQVSVSDGTVTVSMQVTIIVLPVNDPPVANNDYYEARSGIDTAYNVLTNDLPIEAPYKEFYDIYEQRDSVDVLTLVEIVSGPFHGVASFLPNGTLHYKSNFGYQGPDSLRYRMCDSGNLCETAVVFIEVTPPPFKIYEAFSPNGDGLNEYWRIDGIEAFPGNQVRVFDRYGNMVYETSGYRNPDSNNGSSDTHWRGQANHGLSKGTLPEGTYFYAVDLGNGSGVFSGYVILKLK